ncbi:MAG: RluA family pseudouridine synthase [Bacillaceae bacterium]|nr:RluA family pseudouridine synthase [Bacillaceae bacterium]
MEWNSHTVLPDEHNERIDKLLTKLNSDASRTQVQGWIKDELVKVNDETVKSNYKCQTGDDISWQVPEAEPLDIQAENIPLDIVYEDKDVLVVNKPRGMVVHPSAGHASGTLVNALLYHCHDLSGINGVERPGIVHRIDKDTSGLLMVAKNDRAHTGLARQLSKKTVKRKYEAIVHGVISHNSGTIDAPIGRDPKDRQKMAVVENGKEAVTHFQVLKRFQDFTHVECVLKTGRTHQIRVHFQYINHPLAGDPKYGPKKTLAIGGQALHARVLGFEHPVTGEWLEFEKEPPEAFQKVLDDLNKTLDF